LRAVISHWQSRPLSLLLFDLLVIANLFDQVRHGLPKRSAITERGTSLVLDCVMQKRCDHEFRVVAVGRLCNKGGDFKQVVEVWLR
jgi:hypothetical protein